jgi:hypothetical protein
LSSLAIFGNPRQMIRHVVFFSALPGKKKDLLHGLKQLDELKSLGCCQHLEVQSNLKLDKQSNDCDVVVYAEFDSIEKLKYFQEHAIYQDCIKVVRPARELRIAADIDSIDLVD